MAVRLSSLILVGLLRRYRAVEDYFRWDRRWIDPRSIGDPDATLVSQALRQLETFRRDGFMVLRGALSADLVEEARSYLERVVWAPDGLERPPLQVVVTRPGAYFPNETFRLADASSSTRADTYRIECDPDPDVMPLLPLTPWARIVHDPGIAEVVSMLTGGDEQFIGRTPPLVAGCLFNERGTQQGIHDDTWYALGSDEPGGMVGVWVALDDVSDDNGPLLYVPGSHLRSEVVFRPAEEDRRLRLVPQDYSRADVDGLYSETLRHAKELGLEARVFHAKAGDVGIWHERLLHGGDAIQDFRRTRRSLIVHYARRWMTAAELLWEAVQRITLRYGDLQTALREADAGDGVLQLDECRALLEDIGMHLPEPKVKVLLSAFAS
mmetsp:Transcript_112562/g.317925  ORF Transcript_112562/g.317925 Transcript_112562/m.317925 type:complete len:381 (+) Transcript_112562:59-1201(+)